MLDTVIVNQQQNGGAWNVLGSYQFSGQAHVVIRSVSTNTTSADAVRFVPVDISIPKITSTAVVVGSVGMAYSYDVDALSDPESGYQLLDGPVDMMIDPVTGIISWTPSAVGSYPVTVEASNSNGSDTQNFMIVVSQTGSLTLQWTAPVTRTDGTPLSLADIDGYRIFYGDSAGNYPNRLDVPDGTAQSATITDIPVGTYYIVMTTYDVDGRESAYSSMVAKTAP